MMVSVGFLTYAKSLQYTLDNSYWPVNLTSQFCCKLRESIIRDLVVHYLEDKALTLYILSMVLGKDGCAWLTGYTFSVKL